MIRLIKGRSLESLLDIPQAKNAGLTREKLELLLKEINAKKGWSLTRSLLSCSSIDKFRSRQKGKCYVAKPSI